MTGGESGGGREFQRVADALRSRIVDGDYPMGSHLPPQRELAQEFGVSRDTVQRALWDLSSEGWIQSRQGSGSRVVRGQFTDASPSVDSRRRGSVTLGPCMGEAFEENEVALDVFAVTPEPLAAHLYLQAERIHAGAIAPQRIDLRLLLPSPTLPLPYPRVKDDDSDPRPRERLCDITRRHTSWLRETLTALRFDGFVPSVDVEIRHVPLVPLFKLFLFNGVEALYGPYAVFERSVELEPGDAVACVDVLGFAADLTHHVRDADPKSAGSVFVDSMCSWFDSVWTLLGEPSE